MHRLKHIIVLFFLFFLSCEKEKYYQQINRPLNCDSTFYTFDKNIRPILNSNCNFSDCHASGGKASYNYTLYAVVAASVRAGTIDYRIDLPIEHPLHMPKNTRLSSCDYFIIKTWIKQGFAEN